jgi:hypothetical protein
MTYKEVSDYMRAKVKHFSLGERGVSGRHMTSYKLPLTCKHTGVKKFTTVCVGAFEHAYGLTHHMIRKLSHEIKNNVAHSDMTMNDRTAVTSETYSQIICNGENNGIYLTREQTANLLISNTPLMLKVNNKFYIYKF